MIVCSFVYLGSCLFRKLWEIEDWCHAETNDSKEAKLEIEDWCHADSKEAKLEEKNEAISEVEIGENEDWVSC